MTGSGWFSGLASLFKSKRQREKEKLRRRREAFRRSESALGDVKKRLGSLEDEERNIWDEAKAFTRSAHSDDAKRKLAEYRTRKALRVKLDQKRFAFEQTVDTLKLAETDEAFAGALELIGDILRIDPARVDNVLLEVDMKRKEQGEVDRLWEREYQLQTDGVSDDLEGYVPSVEELSKQLEDELAREAGAGAAGAPEGDLKARIEKGWERVRKQLDELGEEDAK